jgi:hypothetical protein
MVLEVIMTKSNPEILNSAFSVHQPFAEQIMLGTKKFEYRSMKTKRRARVYVYASLRDNLSAFEKMKKEPGDFPNGVIVGTVEIVDCTVNSNGGYKWHLANPKRLSKPVKPDNKGQPVWFIPFKK